MPGGLEVAEGGEGVGNGGEGVAGLRVEELGGVSSVACSSQGVADAADAVKELHLDVEQFVCAAVARIGDHLLGPFRAQARQIRNDTIEA